jgi:hypothetical protein
MSCHYHHPPPYPPFFGPPVFPAPLPPSPHMNDLTTLIPLRGFVASTLAFRRPVTDFATFHDLFLAAYHSFTNDPTEYHLHLHFRRGADVQCSKDELLEKEDWESGEYFIGGTIEAFAHFMEKAGDRAKDPVSAKSYTNQPWYPGGSKIPSTTTSWRRGQRQDPDATTVYALGMPSERQYFSAPFVFIRSPQGSSKGKQAQSRSTETWGGFEFPESDRPAPSGEAPEELLALFDESRRSAPAQVENSVPFRNMALAETARLAPAQTHVPTEHREVEDGESSDDRMSSPEFTYASVVLKKEPEIEPSSSLELTRAPETNEQEMDGRTSEGLFVSEESARGRSDESDGSFVSE